MVGIISQFNAGLFINTLARFLYSNINPQSSPANADLPIRVNSLGFVFFMSDVALDVNNKAKKQF